MLDADGREMHGSWGNLISADEAFERMGADVMRWLYCRQPATQNIRFGYGPADEVRRRLLTLWSSARFFLDYAAIEQFEPRYGDLTDGVTGVELRSLDAWLLARTDQLIGEAEAAYDAYLTVDVIDAFETFLEDLSNWYIPGNAGEIAEELRVKEVRFDEGPVARVQLLPNLRPLGPRLGAKLPQVRTALERGDVEELDDGRLRAVGEVLEPDEVIRGERVALEGWAIAEDDGVSVAFDTTVDDELRREGRVLDLVHALNAMRKSAGLELTDRVVVTLPRGEEDLLAYRDRIADEVLAREIRLGDDLEITKA